MKNTLAQNLLAVTALVAAFLVGSGLATADDVAPPVVTKCDGGAQELVSHKTRNFQTSKAGAAPATIVDTDIAGGPSGGATDEDTYAVTFSGEAEATQGGSWTAQAQMSIDGGAFFDMDPVGPNTFLTGPRAQTHTMTWCNREVALVSTAFRIRWAKIGGGQAEIDDYTTRVERSD
jgi:hypothetical protein